MLEQSIERFFREMADKEQPQSKISIQQALREGRTRLRRRRLLRAVGTPALAAAAVLAIAVSGTGLPAGSGSASPQVGEYGKLVGGAFDPSYLAIGFGWLPAGYSVTSGETSPGADTLYAYRAGGYNLSLWVYARNACHLMPARRRLACVLVGSGSGQLIARRGPVIDNHASWWLADLAGQSTLAWEYAPESWAVVSAVSMPTSSAGAASMVRIARAVEYGQHVPVRFASRFTSLPRGWRIVALTFDVNNDGAGRLPAGVYLASSFSIARLRTISPANSPGLISSPNVPSIAVIRVRRQYQCNPLAGGKTRHVTIHGYLFLLSDLLQPGTHGEVLSELALCRGHIDGLAATVFEAGVGTHPRLVFPPTEVMERLQLLGSKPANWVTNPLP
jgi:hypothetical protein